MPLSPAMRHTGKERDFPISARLLALKRSLGCVNSDTAPLLLILFYIPLMTDSIVCTSCILAMPYTAAMTPRAMRARRKTTAST